MFIFQVGFFLTCSLIGVAVCNVIQKGSGYQAIQDREECKNLRGDSSCKSMLSYQTIEQFCNNEYFKKQCQKTCGVCKSNECDNVYDDTNCRSKILYTGLFPCIQEDVQKTCMKTCGLCSDYCEDIDYYGCSDYKIKTTPYGCNNPKMMILCKRSCGYCPAGTCQNKYSDEYCESNKQRCQYANVKKMCKKTCKVADCWKLLWYVNVILHNKE